MRTCIFITGMFIAWAIKPNLSYPNMLALSGVAVCVSSVLLDILDLMLKLKQLNKDI